MLRELSGRFVLRSKRAGDIAYLLISLFSKLHRNSGCNCCLIIYKGCHNNELQHVMAILNIEFKARATDIKKLESQLLLRHPKFVGEDHQVDTYFQVSKGRLKLREGNIENALIWYEREDIAGAKPSDVLLYPHSPVSALRDILVKLHEIKVVVEKKRRIYFIDNVKFHFDTVERLGTFVEVEAIDVNDVIGTVRLQEQCQEYATLFDIQPGDYISLSYSDMLLENITA